SPDRSLVALFEGKVAASRGVSRGSSLPDHSFQELTLNFWSAALSGVGDFEAAKTLNQQLFFKRVLSAPFRQRGIIFRCPRKSCVLRNSRVSVISLRLRYEL